MTSSLDLLVDVAVPHEVEACSIMTGLNRAGVNLKEMLTLSLNLFCSKYVSVLKESFTKVIYLFSILFCVFLISFEEQDT